jgi:hypothetical protein
MRLVHRVVIEEVDLMNCDEVNIPTEAEVRRVLAQYSGAQRRLQEVNRQEPDPDQPGEDRERFERSAQAAKRAEQAARDALSNAVAAYAGRAPCAVIVDSPGGSSVVALSGRPDGLIVAAAADRVPIKDVLCRPEPPPEFAHNYRQVAPNHAGAYLVMQRGDLIAIYNGVYFRSTNEVVADLEELIMAGLEGVWSDDYVVWCDGRIMAVIHQPMDGDHQKLFRFNEPLNDPIAGRVIEPMPHWPTYEEWAQSGRGDLWKTDRYR